jgi:cytidine deaminase
MELQNALIPAESVAEFVKKLKLKDEKSLMVHLASNDFSLAQAPISNFQVSIVGKEKETGDLLLGGNLEFLGAPLGQTVHAEQFLFSRAYHRGNSIEYFALGKATPCGHCRQFINEFQGAKNIRVHNAAGLDFRIGDILPFSFGPEQLKQKGIAAGKNSHKLKLKKKPTKLEDAALSAAEKSYCPYSETPAGVAIKTAKDIFVGSYIENAAFNPSLPPLQAALINLAAAGCQWSDIKEVVLVQVYGKIDFASATENLLKIIAPKASFETTLAKS